MVYLYMLSEYLAYFVSHLRTFYQRAFELYHDFITSKLHPTITENMVVSSNGLWLVTSQRQPMMGNIGIRVNREHAVICYEKVKELAYFYIETFVVKNRKPISLRKLEEEFRKLMNALFKHFKLIYKVYDSKTVEYNIEKESGGVKISFTKSVIVPGYFTLLSHCLTVRVETEHIYILLSLLLRGEVFTRRV